MKKFLTILGIAYGLFLASASFAQSGAALNFNGSNNYVVATYSEPTTNVTHEFWFQTSTANGGLFTITDNIPNPGNYDRDIYLSGGNVNVYVYGGGNEIISTSGTNYADGNWHHLAWVIGASAGGQKLYLDGVLKASGTHTTSSFNWNTKVLLGYARMSGTKYFKGNMDEIRIWNRVLPLCEIQAHMNCELPAGATGIAALYHCNEGVAAGSNAGINTLADASGNGYTGTLGNFSLTGVTSNWVAPGGVASGVPCSIPIISSFTPTSATTGNTVTITGTDLSGTTAVSFGGTAVSSFTVVSSTSVTAVPAAGTSGSVSLTSCDGIASLAGFTFQAPGAGLNFNGSNNYLNIGTPITNAAGYTKEAWIYATASGSCNIISSTNSPFWLTGGKLNVAQHYGMSGSLTINDPAVFPLNTWTHVAATYDLASTTLSLYKNGVQVATSAAAPSYVVQAMQIGIYGGGNYFAGTMDEVRIWNYARTQCQIQADMSCELTGTQPGLLTYYQFNQGVAGGTNTGLTSATDASGNSNTGTLVNFTLSGASSNWVTPGGVTTGVSCSNYSGPLITATTPGSHCGTGTVTLGATSTATTIRWYSTATGGTSLGTGASFTTPSISTTTTYYVEANNGGCLSSARTAVVATINPVPIASISSQTNVSCNAGTNGTVTLSVSGGTLAFTYAWSPSGGTAATASGLTSG
ncbi:MAG: LamG-like jellyroll fold domain-containing protein, partial [Bacteroidia bacterium]